MANNNNNNRKRKNNKIDLQQYLENINTDQDVKYKTPEILRFIAQGRFDLERQGFLLLDPIIIGGMTDRIDEILYDLQFDYEAYSVRIATANLPNNLIYEYGLGYNSPDKSAIFQNKFNDICRKYSAYNTANNVLKSIYVPYNCTGISNASIQTLLNLEVSIKPYAKSFTK